MWALRRNQLEVPIRTSRQTLWKQFALFNVPQQRSGLVKR